MELQIGKKYKLTLNERKVKDEGRITSCWTEFKVGDIVECIHTEYIHNGHRGVFKNKNGKTQILYDGQVTPFNTKLSKIKEGILK